VISTPVFKGGAKIAASITLDAVSVTWPGGLICEVAVCPRFFRGRLCVLAPRRAGATVKLKLLMIYKAILTMKSPPV